MYREFKRLITLIIGFLLMPILTFADGSVVVSWNANTEDDLAGYRIYYGRSSGNYENVVAVGNVTSQAIGNLSSGATYYFVVTAFDQTENESSPSPEVSATIPGDTSSPLTISAVAATNPTASGVAITWTTDKAASSQVEYGLDANYGSVSAIDSQLVASHAVSLLNLIPSTLYHYRVKSKDASGQTAMSNGFTFQTLAEAANATVNLALRKPATASSFNRGRTPAKAVDDSVSTYWRNGSQGGSQTAWLRVDLQSPQTVGRAVIKWRSSYYAKKYELQISNDGADWSAVYANDSGRAGSEDVTFPTVSARYVRLYMTQMNNASYRVNELRLYSGGSQLASTVSEASENLEEMESVELEDDASTAPQSFVLHQNYPNPFNPRTEIKYELDQASHVVLNIYNALGQLVRTLEDGRQSAGQYRLTWDARDDHGQAVPSGAYLYTLEMREEIGSGQYVMSSTLSRQSRSMTLLK